MQRLCVSALAALLSLTAAAQSVFTWTVAHSTSWDTAGNWTPSGGPPNDSNDIAFINVSTNTPVVFSSSTYTIDEIPVNADSNDQSTSLSLSSGSLTTNGRVTIHGDRGSISTNTAALTVNGGTFAPYYLEFNGRLTSGSALSVGDFNASATVGASTLSTLFTGYVDIDIASSVTLNGKAVRVGNGYVPTDVRIGFAGTPGTGTASATSLLIQVGDASSEDSILRLTSGTLNVSGKLKLQAASTIDAKPKLIVSSGTTFTPDTFEFQGGTSSAQAAYLELHASVDLQTADATGVTGFAEAQIDSSVTFRPNEFDIGNGSTTGDFTLVSGSGSTGTISTTQLIIKGGTSASSKVTVNGGKIVTQ
jgi:hypothetical protein